jgi:spore coat polysaccharide biosynthesis protein SpsF (cytidylyltransferase family)
MKIVCIIQARMGSTRLPGKVLMNINGKPMIEYVLNQVKESKLINEIVVATTTKPDDKAIYDKVRELGYGAFQGDEDDVLERYYMAAREFNADVIVRITSDCPLIDPEVIDLVIQKYIDNPCDYCSNVQPPTFPDGLDVEVMPFKAIETAYNEATLKSHREHVTFFLWKNPDRFKMENVENKEDYSELRITVDEKEDFVLVEQIFSKISKRPIHLRDLVELFKNEPDLLKTNDQFERNEGHKKALEEDKKILEQEKLVDE